MDCPSADDQSTPVVRLANQLTDNAYGLTTSPRAGRMSEARRRAVLKSIGGAMSCIGSVAAFAGTPVTTYVAYDAGNQVTSVTDPRGLVTTYVNDGLGQRWQVASPDTGVANASYDVYGRKQSGTRADGVVTTLGYDAISRLTSITANGISQVFTYDSCINGLGRFCSASDPTGTTSYTYAPQGWVVGRGVSIGGVSYSIGNGYNNLGQLTSVVYPDGNIATYSYSNGDVTSVQMTIGGTSHSVVSSITYTAGDDQVVQWMAGNNLVTTTSFDLDGRLSTIQTSGVQDLTFGYDQANRIVKITDAIDAPMTQTFGYDDMSRLTVVNSQADNEAFQYDANGNRTTQAINSLSVSVLTAATSNQITGLSGSSNVSYTYDANGNITTVSGVPTFHFDAFNRLDSAPNAAYYVNAEGMRLRKTVSGADTYFATGPNGILLAESNAGGWSDYIWVNGHLLARTVAGGQLEFLHADQNGRPEAITNASASVVWRARNYAFDRIVTSSTTTALNVGFPGQYYDAETGLWNNGFRDYSANLGRYIESDPLGMVGGINTYAYVDGNPLSYIDPLGLLHCVGAANCDFTPNMSTSLQCFDTCTGRDTAVTCGRDGHPNTDPHMSGNAADIGRNSNPGLSRESAQMCFSQCFPAGSYGQEEHNGGPGTHFHLQDVPGRNNSTGFRQGVADHGH